VDLQQHFGIWLNGSVWFSLRTSARRLWKQYWTFGFHKSQYILEWQHHSWPLKWILLHGAIYVFRDMYVIRASCFLRGDSASLRQWFSKYVCIPLKLPLLTINFHGSIQVLQANIGMVKKFKPRPPAFTYFSVYYSHKSVVLCRCVMWDTEILFK
jgi:hypothetical protein